MKAVSAFAPSPAAVKAPAQTPAHMRTHKHKQTLSIALSLAAAALLQGCAVQPWVKPYERGRLAEPEMQWSRQGLIDKHREHVHVVREAARGATGVQGGGCGCN
jgi:hypothetical protein